MDDSNAEIAAPRRSRKAPSDEAPAKPKRTHTDHTEGVKVRKTPEPKKHAAGKSETAPRVREAPKKKTSTVPAPLWLTILRFIIAHRPKCLSPGWLLVGVLLFVFIFGVLRSVRIDLPAGGIAPAAPAIAPLFTREVQYWRDNIVQWSLQYEVDPNLIATLMQIESCGWSGAASYVGAQGLFQVMPMHFPPEEQAVMTDPEVNVKRGMGVIKDCLGWADGDVGLAMACYNGGPSWIYQPIEYWPAETQRYYRWGGGIYRDAQLGLSYSATLDDWITSGGSGLCQRAATSLNLPPVTSTPAQNLPATPITPGQLATLNPGGAQPPVNPPGIMPTFNPMQPMNAQ